MATVMEVTPRSELLAKVRELWRMHSETLGFFPEGAFDEHAQQRCILAAVDGDRRLLGYALFRTTHRRKAAIVHLCVSRAARGTGIARLLFDAVKVRAASCDDIMVRCRRDFEASKLWPRLGFAAVGEAHGRGKDAKIVTIWRYEMNQPPLFASVACRGGSKALPLAIDANVFFDLDDKLTGHEESKALLADWLGEFIELCVTDEIYNEIDRRENAADRKRQRERAERFRNLSSEKRREAQVLAELQQTFPAWTSTSAQSDMRQLAKAVASKVDCFVTRDGLVRDQADMLYDRYGILVVSPFEVILRFDELRREEEYRPQRFVALGMRKVKPRGEDLDRIADLIHVGQQPSQGRKLTLSRLRGILANPGRYEFSCVTTGDDTLIAAYAIERPAPDLLRIPLLAVAGSILGRTAAHHFAERLVAIAAKEGRTLVEVEREAGGQRIEEALAEAGFSEESNVWIKFAVPLVADASALAKELVEVGSRHPEAMNLARRVAECLSADGNTPTVGSEASEILARVEHITWPAKITGTGLPCFIVPIRPQWAKDLFDTELADRTLFGADPHLVMNSENAYYRSARPAILVAPARILWYVSQDHAYQGTMALRACSYLDEVVVAGPKEAFRRFRRLGIYSWRDVFDVAENDITKKVMAFRFSKTELFRRPIGWDPLQEALRECAGKGSQFQSPVKVSEPCFMKLYQLGMHGA